MRTALYRHFDESGQLLYVGITKEPLRRWAGHTNNSDWVQRVVRIELEWFETWDTAYAAERRAIQAEDPIHNRARPGQTSFKPGRPSRGPQIVGMFEGGTTPRAIAQLLGTSTQAVYNHLKAAGYGAPFVTEDWRTCILNKAAS